MYNIIIKGGIFMKVIIRGKNIELTEGIETKVNKKLNMLDKYFIMSDNVEAKVLIRTYPGWSKNRSDYSNRICIIKSRSY